VQAHKKLNCCKNAAISVGWRTKAIKIRIPNIAREPAKLGPSGRENSGFAQAADQGGDS
jgi:hypothetical protein